MRRLWLVGVAVAMGASASCVNTCVPGKTEPCACIDGRAGAQICRANGTFEPCACTSIPDAGVSDSGFDCSRNSNTPSINFSSSGERVWRLASGQRVELQVEVRDFDDDPVTSTWTVHAEDAGADASGPDASINRVSQGIVHVAVADPGRWVIDLVASDGCRESTHSWKVEVFPAKQLPFAVSDVVCCDSSGRAFAITPLTAKVMRLDMDGSVDSTQILPRVARSLSFNAEGTRLIVGQDAFVSFFRVEDFSVERELPVPFAVNAAISTGDSVWLYGGTSRAQLMAIDAGTVLGMSEYAEDVKRGFMSTDGGWLVVNNSSQFETLPVRSALMRSFGNWENSCQGLWATRGRARFFTGCGEAWEVERDGGLLYAGTLRAQTRFEGLTETTSGDVAASYGGNFLGNPEARLRIVNGVSLAVEADFLVGLQSSNLQTVVPPRFLLPSSTGGVHALTPDTLNDVTWWQEY